MKFPSEQSWLELGRLKNPIVALACSQFPILKNKIF